MNNIELSAQKEMLKKDLTWVSNEIKVIVVVADMLTKKEESISEGKMDDICYGLAIKLNYLLAKIRLQDGILKELKEVCKDA